MGARWPSRVACVACLWFAAARSEASVVAEPIARLTLEGGYDSNVFYDGKGGNAMGRVSPDLGLRLADHTWKLQGYYGGDFLNYGTSTPMMQAWNHRGELRLDARPTRRTSILVDGSGTYAIDPLGLARLGLFGRVTGPSLIVRGGARYRWMAERRLQLSATYDDREVRFQDGGGAAAHTPGAEAAWSLSPRSQLGLAYRFDIFQDFNPVARSNAYAHEVKAVYRYALERHLEIEAEGGPAFWQGKQSRYIVPEAAASLLATSRNLVGRVTLRHGVGLGGVANPVLSDGLEAAFSDQLSRHWRMHAEAGLWRSGAVPSGAHPVLAWSAGGEVAYRVARDLEIGLAASRFDRLDTPSPALRRMVFGLRVSWQLESRFDPHP